MIKDKCLIDSFIKWQRSIRYLTETTFKHSNYVLHSWADFLSFFGKEYLQNASIDALIAFIDKRYNIDKVKDVTIADNLCVLKQFYEYLVKFCGGSTNPTGCLPKFICKKDHESNYLTVDEVFAMLDTCNLKTITGKRDYCCIALLWSTGLRSSEVLKLCWKDIDLEEGTLLVRRGKGIKQRRLFLNDRLLNDIISYRKKILSGPEKPVFCSFKNRQNAISMSSVELCELIKTAASKAGIDKKTTPLTLRHTFATHMYEAGIPIRDVQEMMGHCVTSETSIYIHVTAAAAKRLLNEHVYYTIRKRS